MGARHEGRGLTVSPKYSRSEVSSALWVATWVPAAIATASIVQSSTVGPTPPQVTTASMASISSPSSLHSTEHAELPAVPTACAATMLLFGEVADHMHAWITCMSFAHDSQRFPGATSCNRVDLRVHQSDPNDATHLTTVKAQQAPADKSCGPHMMHESYGAV